MTKLARYTEYKDSQTSIGSIPAHWSTSPIKYVATFNDEVLSESTPPDYEIDYIEISDVSEFKGISAPSAYKFSDAPSRARRVVRAGDILISTVRTYLRAIAQIEDVNDGAIASTGFCVVRPATINPRYLSYAAVTESVVDEVIAQSVGISYPAINSSDLVRIHVPVPSAEEQERIAGFLDRETARIDELIGKQDRLIELLAEKRQAIITHAVTKGLDSTAPTKPSGIPWLGDVPAHWAVGPIKRFFRSLDNRRIPLSTVERSDMQGEFPYYGASGIIDYVDDYIYDEPLVLVSEDGANLLARSSAIAFVAPGRYWVNNHAHILQPITDSMEFWAARIECEDLTPAVTGSAQPKLTIEALMNLQIAAPLDSEETHRIQEFIAQRSSSLDELLDKARSVTRVLKERRSALISAAVTGKIDVQEGVA